MRLWSGFIFSGGVAPVRSTSTSRKTLRVFLKSLISETFRYLVPYCLTVLYLSIKSSLTKPSSPLGVFGWGNNGAFNSEGTEVCRDSSYALVSSLYWPLLRCTRISLCHGETLLMCAHAWAEYQLLGGPCVHLAYETTLSAAIIWRL